jgi:hypothetical protein
VLKYPVLDFVSTELGFVGENLPRPNHLDFSPVTVNSTRGRLLPRSPQDPAHPGSTDKPGFHAMLARWTLHRPRCRAWLVAGTIYTRRCLSNSRDGERVFVGIGSNVGDRAALVQLAIDRMRALWTVVSTSYLYQSEP